MTTEELTRTTVSAEVRTTLETQLTAVNAAIAEREGQLKELHATRTWLEGVLAAAVDTEATPAPAAAPTPQEPTAAAVPAAEGSVPAKGNAKAKAKTGTGTGTAAASPGRRVSPRRQLVQRQRATAQPAAAAPTLPQRVQGFLAENSGPQKAAEIAQGLFGTDVVPANVSATRAALEGLLKRGAVEKSKQGSTVYYEAAASGATAPAN
ncbi:hypothetical protein [Streptacidiphilus sp. PAMC 29251]